MPLILSLALGAVGLVLIRSAFATPPDPREVLRSLFAGGSLFESTSGKSMGGPGAVGGEGQGYLPGPATNAAGRIGTVNPNVE